MLYEIKARIKNEYLSNGIIDIKDDTFEGYLTDDYIVGEYKNGKIRVTLFIKELNINGIFQESDIFEREVLNFESLKVDFELPKKYTLYCIDEGKMLEIDFIQKKNDMKKEEFQRELNKISSFF